MKLPPKIKAPFQTFSNETKEEILQRDGHKCKCLCEKCKPRHYLSIHHIVENRKYNQRLYGDKLQGEENGVLLCQYCHERCTTKFKHLKLKLIEKWDSLENHNQPNSKSLNFQRTGL